MPPKKLVIIKEIKIKPILGCEILVSILVAVSRYNRNDWNLTLPLYSCYSCIHDSSLFDYTTIQLYNYTTIQLYNYTTVQLYNYTTIHLYNYTTIQLYNYTTIQL